MYTYTLQFKSSLNIIQKDLEKSLTLSGFYLISHTEKDSCIVCNIARCGKIQKSHLYKLFKNLNRTYKCKHIQLEQQKCKDNIVEANISKGSGVRAGLAHKGEYVRKTYLPQKDVLSTFFQNEIESRELLKDLKGIVPITNKGEDWFEMPYIKNEYNYNPHGLKLYSLDHFRKIIELVNSAYEKGVCLVDWNLDAFRFKKGDVYFVDYEYCYKHTNTDKYEISPDITGIGQEQTTVLDEYISIDNYWQKHIGLTLQQYLNEPQEKQVQIRRAYFFKKRLPKYISNKLNNVLKTLKNALRYSIKENGNIIVIKQR